MMMRCLHSWSALCCTIAVLFLLSVTVHPAMAAEEINKKFDSMSTMGSADPFGSAATGGHKRPTVDIREIDPAQMTKADLHVSAVALSTAPDAMTVHNGPITLHIRDPLAVSSATAQDAAAGTGSAGIAATAVPAGGPELASAFANMTDRGYALADQSTHRYEDHVTSEDFLKLTDSQKAKLQVEGFVLESSDTTRSYRDVTYYNFHNADTGKNALIMAVQRLDATGSPIGERQIAVSNEFSSGPSMASASALSATAGTIAASSNKVCWKDGCIIQWIAIVLCLLGLVADLILLILTLNGKIAPNISDGIAYGIYDLLTKVLRIVVPNSTTQRAVSDFIWQLRPLAILAEVVGGLALMGVLAYCIYELGTCACWWDRIDFSPVALIYWDPQYTFTEADNGKAVTLDLHDRIAVGLKSDTLSDPSAKWEVSSSLLTPADSVVSPMGNVTYQEWLFQADSPGNAVLTFRYVSEKPSTIPSTVYTLNVTVKEGNWKIETIDSTSSDKGTGFYPSLVFGNDGKPHISYYAPCWGGVRYATRDANSWITKTVGGSRGTFRTSIDINPKTGSPAFTYSETDTSGDLVYAYLDGTQWKTEVIQHGNTWAPGKYNSLKFTADGVPHVAYSSTMAYSNLMYATRQENGGWSLEKVDTQGPTGDTGYNPSLAFNASGYPFIAYRTGWDHANLMFAEKNENGAWVLTTVDDANNWGDTGHFASLALDSHNNPHISYYTQNTHDRSNNGLRYAYRNSTGMWSLTTLSKANKVGQWSSIVVDKYDQPIISSYDEVLGYLKVAKYYNSTGTWVQRTIDTDGNVGACTSIALDPSGNPAIAYLDYTHKALKIATYHP